MYNTCYTYYTHGCSVFDQVSHMLFVSLLSFTEGETQSKVILGGEEESSETNRYLYTHGRVVSMRQRMSMRTEAMIPEWAVSITDVEKCMTDCESTLRYLREVGEPVLEAEQMITIMISMMHA